jgi:hypothetical protein
MIEQIIEDLANKDAELAMNLQSQRVAERDLDFRENRREEELGAFRDKI